MRSTRSTLVKRNATWLFIGWMAFSFAWLWVVSPGCPPTYYMHTNEITNYSDLLNRHGGLLWVLRSPLFAFVVSVLVATPLALCTKRWALGVLVFPLALSAACVLFANIFCDGTTLRHVESVEFGGNVYHLTLGYEVASGADVYFQTLYLHQCNQDGTRCLAREITRSYLDPIVEPKLQIDTDQNQLVVLTDNDVLLKLNQDGEPVESSSEL